MSVYELGYLISAATWLFIFYVAYRVRFIALNLVKWVVTKTIIIVKLPVVFVKCLFASIVAKEVRKQLWAKEAEDYAKRNQ